jgi:hypothetical protein
VDPRISYAQALVEMRNVKYDVAKRLLDEALIADKGNTAMRRTKIWVLMVTRDYPAAIVELETLSKLLRDDQAIDRAKPDSAPVIEFMGRMFGFLDGPARSAVTESVRADYRKRILSDFSTAERMAFDAAYDAVLRRFAELDLDRQQTRSDAKADEQKKQERARQELERERTRVGQEKSTLEQRASSSSAEFERRLADVDNQLRPLVVRQSRLEAQGSAITREMAGLQAEIARLLDLADNDDDPVDAARLRAEARRLAAALGRYDVDLRAVNSELAGLAAQRATLAGQRRSVIAGQQAETDRIDRRATELRNTERRITTDEKKANQPVGGNTGAVASLAAKSKAFTTYDAFPFEEERARLLQSFRQ